MILTPLCFLITIVKKYKPKKTSFYRLYVQQTMNQNYAEVLIQQYIEGIFLPGIWNLNWKSKTLRHVELRLVGPTL